MTYAVIMAGGAGTRFWPKSRVTKPKQFIKLFGNETMLQKTVSRLHGFLPHENMMVITNEDYVSIVNDQVPQLSRNFIIGEPLARNTAPCVAAAASLLYKKDPEGVMVVLPADHLIGNNDEFYNVLQIAVNTAVSENSLVTIGIEPNRPETGYGYIRRKSSPAHQDEGHSVFEVRNFTEKPELTQAEAFLESGDYLWNSGMFIWKVSAIVDAFRDYLPEIYTNMETLIQSSGEKSDIDAFYKACPSISIDYGIMEKAEKVHVVPGNFNWNDVGSWKAVHELSDKDSDENASGASETLFLKSSSNLVHSDSGKLFAFAGVKNLAIIETEDSILVVNLDHSQDVKEIYEHLKNNPEKEKYL